MVALALVGSLVALGSDAAAAPVAVGLGTADSFAVLAGTGITNTGPTTITGDIGTFPTATITGLTSVTVYGTNHAGDSVTQGAKTDLTTAYTTAAGEGPTTAIAADLVGRTFKPGVYNSASAVGLSGVLTLDAAGDPNAVWVFQAGLHADHRVGQQGRPQGRRTVVQRLLAGRQRRDAGPTRGSPARSWR